MQEFNAIFSRLSDSGVPSDPTLESLLLALLLAFVVGQLVACVYVWTHSGISYSRSFSQSLVLLTIIASLVMSVIGNSIVAAFGLIGALAIIRFRNVLKDTRDTAFVFLTLVLGMAIGSQRFSVAVVGGAFLLLVAGWLHLSSFGTRGRFDGHLSFTREGILEDIGKTLRDVIRRHCRNSKTVTVHDTGDHVETVYQVRLRDRRRSREMIDELRALDGVSDVVLVLRDHHAEV